MTRRLAGSRSTARKPHARCETRVIATARLIAEHPLIGTSRPELAPEPFRFSVIRGYPYLAVYDATTRPPTIMRIVHGARDLPEVLKDL